MFTLERQIEQAILRDEALKIIKTEKKIPFDEILRAHFADSFSLRDENYALIEPRGYVLADNSRKIIKSTGKWFHPIHQEAIKQVKAFINGRIKITGVQLSYDVTEHRRPLQLEGVEIKDHVFPFTEITSQSCLQFLLITKGFAFIPNYHINLPHRKDRLFLEVSGIQNDRDLGSHEARAELAEEIYFLDAVLNKYP